MKAPGHPIHRFYAVCLGCALFFVLADAAFRVALPVSDIPYWTSDPVLGYRHVPHLSGRFASGAFAARFRLNNRGWNNPKDYSRPRGKDTRRVAIIGDSYVEALQVDVGKSLGPLLERLLKGVSPRVEVRTYGISGASTAYAHDLLRREVLADRPDLVIYLWIDNDVADSVPFLGSAQRWGPKYDLDPAGALARLPVRVYAPRWASRALSHSALFRYFWINRGLGTKLQERSVGRRTPETAETELWIRAWDVTGLLIAEMAEDCRKKGAGFLVVNHPESDQFYPIGKVQDPYLMVSNLAQQASRRGFEFVDLSPWFARDWSAHQSRFEFPTDYHWNEHGHQVAAQALRDIVSEELMNLTN